MNLYLRSPHGNRVEILAESRMNVTATLYLDFGIDFEIDSEDPMDNDYVHMEGDFGTSEIICVSSAFAAIRGG